LTNKNYLRTVTDVKAIWLFEIAAEYFNPRNIKNVDTRKELEKIEK
jgi:pre-mRNA-splicing factor ATP-dependent RNA helicase DHX15/PRP43